MPTSQRAGIRYGRRLLLDEISPVLTIRVEEAWFRDGGRTVTFQPNGFARMFFHAKPTLTRRVWRLPYDETPFVQISGYMSPLDAVMLKGVASSCK